MQTISVYLPKDQSACQTYRDLVDTLLQQLQTYPVVISYREEMLQDDHLFRFQSWCHEEYTCETRDRVRVFVAITIAEWIKRVREPQLLEQYVEQDWLIETAEEISEILPFVQRILDEPIPGEEKGAAKAILRKAKLYRKVFEYLQENGEMIVEGFIRFRLKDYQHELLEAVELGIDDYLEEKHYQEFVELLKYLIAIQETRYQLVHVVPHSYKQYQLYDQAGTKIQLEQLDAVFHSGEWKRREEDYLISALVTIAPQTIVFHLADQKQALVQTIGTIFENRLVYCSSCAYCLTNKNGAKAIEPRLDANNPTHL
ncbi:putative sporulation protein YtxC [Brevibacillus fulvus]|uniref:Sporulation protein YtxC n=1 Tax=Brevibacillus fulvus TaxID=1125967 RepID=A0A938XTF3_9BACL|nr:putative sporulation protein YtxC [Brevibacillus fulvus]MBM7590138.1 putative sporulation protein YtxC [Brevibacillus fulvus]